MSRFSPLLRVSTPCLGKIVFRSVVTKLTRRLRKFSLKHWVPKPLIKRGKLYLQCCVVDVFWGMRWWSILVWHYTASKFCTFLILYVFHQELKYVRLHFIWYKHLPLNTSWSSRLMMSEVSHCHISTCVSGAHSLFSEVCVEAKLTAGQPTALPSFCLS